jgi:hypothetical protein
MDGPGRRFKIVTAFSADYTAGRLCARVNRCYAARHGYSWWEQVLGPEDMLAAVAPRTHCTWYKVHIFLAELRRALGRTGPEDGLASPRVDPSMEGQAPLPALDGSAAGGDALRPGDYLVWMDADAVFVEHERKLEEVVAKAEDRDLVIGEDMHVGNLVNCGVILIRVSLWSLQLWEAVFRCRRYDSVTYFEQSALHKVLKMSREFGAFGQQKQKNGRDGETERIPWHSFCVNDVNGNFEANVDGLLHFSTEDNVQDRIKIFEHTAVFPMHLLNSNICDEDIERLALSGEAVIASRQHRKGRHHQWRHQKTRFVYHAAGFTRKIPVISAMVKRRLPDIDISDFDHLCR